LSAFGGVGREGIISKCAKLAIERVRRGKKWQREPVKKFVVADDANGRERREGDQ
jgi:hypothetical protein